MTYQDKLKLAELDKVFSLNFKLTRLYASYLNNFPNAITEDIIKAVTDDGDIEIRDALGAVICQLFGLDYDGSDEERRLIRDYILPSIRILDADKYRSNPYYKNVKIPNVTDGSWELRREAYEPYRAVIANDMIIYDDFREVAPLGFFTEKFEFPAVLENGNEWMTLTPVDLDTCDEAIDAAHGDVITFGLGLGYYAYMVSLKEDVRSITVIEKSADVIRLFERYIFPYFPHKDKVKIINADAFEYAEFEMPRCRYDFAFVDTWRDASDGAPMYEKMSKLEKLNPDCEFRYWIRNFLTSRLRALEYERIRDALARGGADAPCGYDEIASKLRSI